MKQNLQSLIFTCGLATCPVLTPLPTLAQDASESGGLLVSFLEDTLSGDSRTVSVEGLEGAFSSQAKIAKLTVSDAEGIWLTVEGAELDWNRLALVRGRFSVNHLKADRITVARSPEPVPADPELPTPEATPFRLPELPVSIEIGDIAAGEIRLGEALTGQAASLSVDGALTLADGALETDLNVARLDRRGDALHLAASFSNTTEQLALDIALDEAPGGLLSTAMDLPGRPDLRLAIKGEGPLTDFTADIGFASNSHDRITGTVSLRGLGDVDSDTDTGLAFSADMGGDIDPLLPPAYRPFFGPGMRANVKGRSLSSGGVELDNLVLRTRALQLTGALRLDAGMLQTANLKAAITAPEGQAAVILPVSGADTTVAAVTMDLKKPEGENWTINAELDSLRTADLSIKRAVVNAAGALDQDAGFNLDGALDARLSGFVLSDPALAAATGSELSLSAQLTTKDGADFLVRDLELQGDSYSARGELRFDRLEGDLRIATTLSLLAENVSRYSVLAGLDLSGSAEANVSGHFQPLSGAFGVDLALLGRDLGTAIPNVDPLLVGESRLKLVAARDTAGIRIDQFHLQTAEVSATGQGTLDSGEGALRLDATLARLDRFVTDLPGPLTLSANFDRSGNRLDGTVALRGPQKTAMDLDGSFTLDGAADFGFEAFVGAPEAFVPELAGAPVIATGTATRRAAQWTGDMTLTATGGTRARIKGGFHEADGAIDLDLSALLARVEQFAPAITGQATARLIASRRDGQWQAKGDVTAPGDTTATFDAGFVETSGDLDLKLKAEVAEVRAYAPTLPGRASADISATRRAGAWAAGGKVTGPAGTAADLDVELSETDGTARVRFDALVRELQQIVPGLDGALSAKGEARRADGIWTVESTADGPLGMASRLAGTWDEARAIADVSAKGTLRLEGANAFLKPNLIKGLAEFDLALRGPAQLNSVSGTITTSGAQMVLPQAAQTIEGISTRISLNNGSAAVNLSARPRDGGRIEVNGPVSLAAPYAGDLRISLADVVLTDNLSFDTSLGGQLRFSGALAGNSRLSGRIDIGETNFNLNTAGGAVSAAPIPPIRHVGQTGAQIATRARAGLIETGSAASKSNSNIALDVLISAPNKIFARGRGLNAELGGTITVGGTTANLAPSGQVGLIRGTFDILGRRLNLDEGRVTLLGDLKPYLEFVSSANTEQGTATLSIAGPLDGPQIKVTSEPPRPSEEALALLLFGDNIQDISPLALARLASSALTLSGRGGGANKALRDSTGADNADIGIDNLGVGQLGLGGYLADNVYTDVNVTAEGNSELSINLDLTKSLTVTGKADSEGETGLGVYFKRDY